MKRARIGPRVRVSRFRTRKPKTPTPRFTAGDTAGNFTVLEYLKYSAVKPTGTPTRLCQEHHWYRVRCSCGTEETHTQQQLIDTRRHRACASCVETIAEAKEA